MPRYEMGCDTCGEFWDEIRPMSESDAPCVCPRCKDPGRRVWRTPPGNRVVDVSGYQPGLALKPGDPSAWVESRHSLDKLIDQRRREGHGPPLDL